jgi:hypothetical protein
MTGARSSVPIGGTVIRRSPHLVGEDRQAVPIRDKSIARDGSARIHRPVDCSIDHHERASATDRSFEVTRSAAIRARIGAVVGGLRADPSDHGRRADTLDTARYVIALADERLQRRSMPPTFPT